jgi:GTPase SAR1 family protein
MISSQKPTYKTLKIAFLGGSVGKSSIIKRYLEDSFSDEYFVFHINYQVNSWKLINLKKNQF